MWLLPFTAMEATFGSLWGILNVLSLKIRFCALSISLCATFIKRSASWLLTKVPRSLQMPRQRQLFTTRAALTARHYRERKKFEFDSLLMEKDAKLRRLADLKRQVNSAAAKGQLLRAAIQQLTVELSTLKWVAYFWVPIHDFFGPQLLSICSCRPTKFFLSINNQPQGKRMIRPFLEYPPQAVTISTDSLLMNYSMDLEEASCWCLSFTAVGNNNKFIFEYY